jgi:hypothetical protein
MKNVQSEPLSKSLLSSLRSVSTGTDIRRGTIIDRAVRRVMEHMMVVVIVGRY